MFVKEDQTTAGVWWAHLERRTADSAVLANFLRTLACHRAAISPEVVLQNSPVWRVLAIRRGPDRRLRSLADVRGASGSGEWGWGGVRLEADRIGQGVNVIPQPIARHSPTCCVIPLSYEVRLNSSPGLITSPDSRTIVLGV